jgi:hypothetical protein
MSTVCGLTSTIKEDFGLNNYTFGDSLHAIMVDDQPDRNGWYQKHEVDKRTPLDYVKISPEDYSGEI